MMRVLVIDDQKIPRVTVAAMLQQAGYEAAAATSGPEGIERAREWCPDVVVLDVHMPGMDGFETVRHLKADPGTAPIPVIFLTAESPTDELVVRGLELGAYDFLNKGCSRAELLARVGAMARIKRSYDELAALAQLSDVVLHTHDPGELAGSLVRQVARTFRADAALLVLSASEAAGEVRAASGMAADGATFFHLVDTLAERLCEGREPHPRVLGDEDATVISSAAGLDFGSIAAACVRRGESRPLLLAVFTSEPGAFRHSGDVPLLGMLARQATLALDNAILHTQAREQARTLEEQALRLERAMTERSRFFASMSHELRTPINAILGFGQLLEDGVYGTLEATQHRAAERVVRSARHLLDLVNDILDISKLEAGKMEVYPEPVDLAGLVRDIVTSVELQAAQKGLALEVDAPECFPAATDAGRVRQIVLNLLSNAVKFTDHGEVRLSLDEDEEGWALVRVADTGPGIAAEDRDRIFSEFEQAQAAVSRGGTGLGLPISRRLASLLGGTLSLASTPGEGSVFTLRIPRRAPGYLGEVEDGTDGEGATEQGGADVAEAVNGTPGAEAGAG